MQRTTRRLISGSAAAVLVWSAGAWPAVGQKIEPPAPAGAALSEQVDVELVNVDVWVTDRKGNTVTGLEPADFEVLHDGSVVPISHFTEVRAGEAIRPGAQAAEGKSGPAEKIPSHVVVYFDQSRLHPTHYPPLIRGLEEFLNLEEVEPANVLIVRHDRGLFVEAPFGSSRKDLEAALGRLAGGTPSGAALRSETDQALNAIRQSWENNQDTASSASVGIASIPQTTPGGTTGVPGGGPRAALGGVGTGGASDACGSFVGEIQPILSSWARSRGARTALTLSTLSDIASFLAGVPGVKTLLYLSDGLETDPGSALASYAAGFCPEGSAQLLSRSRSEEMTSGFLELTRHANTNRVTVHALQASGLQGSRRGSAAAGRRARGGGARSGGSFERVQRSSDRRGLELIAGETGGRAVVNQNEYGPELGRIARELGTYYSLAYVPPADEADGGPGHWIEVQVGEGSLNARYRRGYLEKDAPRWLLERIEGALNLGISANPLEIRLGAGTVSGGEAGRFQLPLHVMVPAERLTFLPRDGASMAEIVVRVMARSIGSSQAFMVDKTFLIPGEPGATGLADLVLVLELASGAHLTAVGVQDTTSREASFVSTTLQIGSEG